MLKIFYYHGCTFQVYGHIKCWFSFFPWMLYCKEGVTFKHMSCFRLPKSNTFKIFLFRIHIYPKCKAKISEYIKFRRGKLTDKCYGKCCITNVKRSNVKYSIKHAGFNCIYGISLQWFGWAGRSMHSAIQPQGLITVGLQQVGRVSLGIPHESESKHLPSA